MGKNTVLPKTSKTNKITEKKGFVLIEYIIATTIILTILSGVTLIFSRSRIREKDNKTKIEAFRKGFKDEENLLTVLKYVFKNKEFQIVENEIILSELPVYSIAKSGDKVILFQRDFLNNRVKYMDILTGVSDFHVESKEDILYFYIKRGEEVWERIVNLKDM